MSESFMSPLLYLSQLNHLLSHFDCLRNYWVICPPSSVFTCYTFRIFLHACGLNSLTEDVAECMYPWRHFTRLLKTATTLFSMQTSEDANAPPPFTCITSGCYIGVFTGETYMPMVKGITNTVYFGVESLEVGEKALRNAIERLDIVRFPMPSQ
ncbi:uncharacterized protein F5147DRAFT_653446 [Suillus discolor]|uniref:Uncharacterized protein n=1 Tax=Suillus discolor TaxID=1912936 RepID=A0A9P7F6T1_9AGAM|nr:uncharacterized protein F5147DRAFT_653446 [Suillus discolor]KAG2107221.1 hypothetical protein F5147DRAFT_653446 [Suillus discolor]